MLETGKKLQERYRIEKQVGQGGMGSIYLATDERFHSTVAIKEALFADENYKKAFDREARLLNSLKHSALPKVTDHFVEDNGQYIVMEFIGGDDLFEQMRKAGRAFPVNEVLEWADQLLEALAYLHEQGIIHRDIKPQNLKLTPQQKIILLDFGLAKGNPTDANFQTAAKSIFGYSRNYASLEQIQGTGTDPRSDVYSLAATLYHLMTDRVPADALTRVMMVLNESRDPLEPAGKFNSEISQEVSDALQTCLSLKANDRPANVGEMKSLLFSGTSTPFVLAAGTPASVENEELLTMDTKLIDHSTGGKSKPSEFKTEVMGAAAGDSASTKIANRETRPLSASDTQKAQSRGSFGLLTAIGLITLIVGGVAATVFFGPSLFSSETTSPGASTSPLPGANTSNMSDLKAVEALEDNTSDEMPEDFKLESTPRESTLTAASTPKNEQKASASSKPKPTQKTSAVGRSNDFEVGDVKITDGRLETDKVTINDEGIKVKTPTPVRKPRTVRGLPITREQYEKLTPRQKRRVRDAMERERRRRMNLPPRPKPGDTKPPPPN